MPDRLKIPEKLYGRDAEVRTLIDAFDRVASRGTVACVLVSGYPGIGKSSLVNELLKRLILPRGLLAAGKFDQYARNVPYSTLAEAFGSLVRQVLIRSAAELQSWRAALTEALGQHGALIAKLVPEIERVIGEQPPVPELPAQEAKNRFQHVLKRFIGVFARSDPPLVLFLDDLQWQDAATLETMHYLLTSPDLSHLLIIGAYRDGEVGPVHPLKRTLEAIRQSLPTVQEIALAPMTSRDVEALIADTLHVQPLAARPLAQLTYEKAGGNPFFTTQFLTMLAEERLLSFETRSAVWQWDLDRIREKGYTDNVLALMSGRLTRLPARTQEALRHFACLSHSAELTTLAMILGESEDAIELMFAEAVRVGLVLPSKRAFRFLHDRVREAAYALIPQQERCGMHLRIARILETQTSPDAFGEHIFEIVNHYNRSVSLLQGTQERERVAALNLEAALRARESSAYGAARTYLTAGRELLPPAPWKRHYALTFSLELHGAECEILAGELKVAEIRLQTLSRNARNTVDRAAVTCQQITLYTALDQTEKAIEACLAYLRGIGIEWSLHPTPKDFHQEYEQIRRRLADRSIEEFASLPLCTDTTILATMNVLTTAHTAACHFDNNLNCLIVCRMVNLSLEYGNSDAACYAYVILGMILGPRFGAYREGFSFGKLAHTLVEKHRLQRFEARVLMCFGNIVSPWVQHVRLGREWIRRAFVVAHERGDLNFAAYSSNHLAVSLLLCGDPLVEVQRETEMSLDYCRKARVSPATDVAAAELRLVKSLRGIPRGPGPLDESILDDSRFQPSLDVNPNPPISAFLYWLFTLQLHFFHNDYAVALEAAARAEQLLWTSPSFLQWFELPFYAAMTRAACHDSSAEEDKPRLRAALLHHYRQIETGAHNCPENFGCRSALVSAEIARLDDRPLDATKSYERAIQLAREQGFVSIEGLACEFAGRFHRTQGLPTIADAYIANARGCYERWGATRKVRELDESHPHLHDPAPSSVLRGTIDRSVAHLDVETVVRASQTLSGEMNLPTLIEKLLQLAIIHAGAERGLLLQVFDFGPRIEAEGTSGPKGVRIAVRQERIRSVDLPQSMLRYVLRTHQRVLIDDASAGRLEFDDDYVRLKRSRSVLCLPILKQTKVIGVLYLENSLTPRAFTPGRIAILELLVAQAAISLENARLYSDLVRSEALLARSQDVTATGSFTWCLETGEITWSKQTYRIFGFEETTPATLESIMSRIHPQDRHLTGELLGRVRSGSSELRYEHRLLMPDHSVKYLQVIAQETQDQTGHTVYLGIIQDVTQRRLAEEELGRARSELARVARISSLGMLTASIIHELNSPLAGILINSGTCLLMLEKASPDIDGARETAQHTIRAANRASEVIKRLRALFTNKAASMEEMDLNEATREVIALSLSELQRSHVIVRTELADGLPSVTGDRIQLQQVILNLLLNARDAMLGIDDRPRELLIKTALDDEGHVRIAVRDAGVGFEPASAEKLFQAFYTTKADGMGIGLSISRSIIDHHRGRLWAEPNEGHGATFWFAIPATAAVVGDAAGLDGHVG